jgi:hypothetical protein
VEVSCSRLGILDEEIGLRHGDATPRAERTRSITPGGQGPRALLLWHHDACDHQVRAGLTEAVELDGQRAQLQVRAHRTVHAFSRPGRELLQLPGLAWLRDIRWPLASAVLDGEAVAGDGSEGIQAVFEARNRPGSPMAFKPSKYRQEPHVRFWWPSRRTSGERWKVPPLRARRFSYPAR